jgi:hypothetical protein
MSRGRDTAVANHTKRTDARIVAAATGGHVTLDDESGHLELSSGFPISVIEAKPESL